LNLRSTSVTAGDTLEADYRYQSFTTDFGVEFYLDNNTNPYDGYFDAWRLGARFHGKSTVMAGANNPATLTVPSNVTAATYYVFIKSTGSGMPRYFYAPTPLIVAEETVQQVPGSETVTLTANADTYIKEANPTLNFGSASLLRTTTDTNDNYGLIKFNLNSIPAGSVISDVELKLYCSYYAGSQIYIAESDSYWSESSVTWDTKPTQGYEYPFFYNITGIGYQQITHSNLTNLVNDWVNGTESNYGIYLYAGNVGDNISYSSSENSNSSYRPKLIVNYTPPLLPDLIIANLHPNPSPPFTVGQSIDLHAQVNNIGNGPADSSSVGCYLGTSKTDLSNPIYSYPTSALDSAYGESKTNYDAYSFAASDVGQRYLICEADYRDDVEENSDNNNTRVYGPFNVVELTPELSITPDSQSVNSNSGTTTFTVNNTGSGTMPWTASVVSGGSWLSITSGSSGTDSGTITAEFSANATASSRTGTIRVIAPNASVSSQDVTVLQSDLDNNQCSFAYIPNSGSNTVSVIDISTNIVVDTIIVGSIPYGIAVSPLGTHVYVTHQGSNSVSVIDTSTKTVVDTITVGNDLMGLAVNPSDTLLYVVDAGSATVSVIDTSTNTITDTIDDGFVQPIDILMNPSGTLIYVSNHTGHFVSVIDTSTNNVIDTITVAGNPMGLATNPSGTRLYVSGEGNYFSVIDTSTNTVIESIDLGRWSTGVAVNSAGTVVYVATYDEADLAFGSISVIDTSTNTIVDTITVGAVPYGLSVNPSDTHVYVINAYGNTVSVIDTSTNTVIDTIPVGDVPVGLGHFISTENCKDQPV
ncbi:hypothetical protein LCGC14_1902290, partial [marine sediment metagenome]